MVCADITVIRNWWVEWKMAAVHLPVTLHLIKHPCSLLVDGWKLRQSWSHIIANSSKFFVPNLIAWPLVGLRNCYLLDEWCHVPDTIYQELKECVSLFYPVILGISRIFSKFNLGVFRQSDVFSQWYRCCLFIVQTIGFVCYQRYIKQQTYCALLVMLVSL